MLKKYVYGGLVYQFEEGKQPAGAVEVKEKETLNKQAAPANKARRPRTKAVK